MYLVGDNMTIKTLAITALMTLAVTSSFASKMPAKQMAMAPSMDDQDYSGWKAGYKKMKMTPAGASSSMKMMDMMPEFKDEYDAKVYKFLMRMAAPEHRTPARPFDWAEPMISYDVYWMGVEKKLNTYRRELIREDEARGMAVAKMMGRPMPSMSSGM